MIDLDAAILVVMWLSIVGVVIVGCRGVDN
jgi:hypothetical protein